MSWTLTAWAQGSNEQATRVQVKGDYYDTNEEFGLRAEASGLFRRTYGDWPLVLGSSAVNDAGQEAPRGIPPSRLLDEIEGRYSVPDEAVAEGEA